MDLCAYGFYVPAPLHVEIILEHVWISLLNMLLHLILLKNLFCCQFSLLVECVAWEWHQRYWNYLYRFQKVWMIPLNSMPFFGLRVEIFIWRGKIEDIARHPNQQKQNGNNKEAWGKPKNRSLLGTNSKCYLQHGPFGTWKEIG